MFQYLMNDVNEWSSEYGVKVESFSNLAESPHSWDKRVLNITPVKSGRNHRFRLGLQMFRMKTNESYSLIVELYNRDYKTWQRQQTYINGTGMWVISSNTAKYQHQYGSSGDLYYSKTLIKVKKTSSTAPIFVYFTAHFDDNGGDMNTYPKEFKNQVYIVAYGVEGLSDHVDPGVYDAHEAFEIDKTKMKMLVPLDMNGKKIMNTNYDLKFKDLFKITFKHFKILDESITISGILLVIIRTISGGLTLNRIVLGVINGFGILLTNFGKMKNYKNKIEMLKIAFTSYEKVLVELRSALRGDEFDKDQFIDKMKVVDAMILDQTPLADKYVKLYDKK